MVPYTPNLLTHQDYSTRSRVILNTNPIFMYKCYQTNLPYKVYSKSKATDFISAIRVVLVIKLFCFLLRTAETKGSTV